jgi:hypothetical protein
VRPRRPSSAPPDHDASARRLGAPVLSVDDLLAALGAGEAERTEWYRNTAGPHLAAGDEYRRRKDSLRSLLGDPEGIRSQRGVTLWRGP